MSIKTAQLLAVAVALCSFEAVPARRVLVFDDDAGSYQKPAPLLTHCDEERIRKAEAKRARKAAKRLRREGGEA